MNAFDLSGRAARARRVPAVGCGFQTGQRTSFRWAIIVPIRRVKLDDGLFLHEWEVDPDSRLLLRGLPRFNQETFCPLSTAFNGRGGRKGRRVLIIEAKTARSNAWL